MPETAPQNSDEILDQNGHPIGLTYAYHVASARGAERKAQEADEAFENARHEFGSGDKRTYDAAADRMGAIDKRDAEMWRGQQYYRDNKDTIHQYALNEASAAGVDINVNPPVPVEGQPMAEPPQPEVPEHQ